MKDDDWILVKLVMLFYNNMEWTCDLLLCMQNVHMRIGSKVMTLVYNLICYGIPEALSFKWRRSYKRTVVKTYFKAIKLGKDKEDENFYKDRTSRRSIMEIWSHTEMIRKDVAAMNKFNSKLLFASTVEPISIKLMIHRNGSKAVIKFFTYEDGKTGSFVHGIFSHQWTLKRGICELVSPNINPTTV